MEKEKAKREGPSIWRLALPLISGIVGFCLCLCAFPFIMLRLDDPVAFVPHAAISGVALSAFFASHTASRTKKLHFALTALITALVISALLFGAALLLGNVKDYGFMGISCAAALVFSLLGARLGVNQKKRRRKKR